jgi:hypothetical protein
MTEKDPRSCPGLHPKAPRNDGTGGRDAGISSGHGRRFDRTSAGVMVDMAEYKQRGKDESSLRRAVVKRTIEANDC